VKTRVASLEDAPAIAVIYNQGIEDRLATFETRPHSADEVRAWFDGFHPIVVVESDEGQIVAYAATFSYRTRDFYRGVAEFSVYVDRDFRLQGAGSLAMEALMTASREAGLWKLVSRIFVENLGSRHLLARLRFREVGVYERHAQLDGEWRNVVIVERLL
jgi:phosphinothricin acetyltransferase